MYYLYYYYISDRELPEGVECGEGLEVGEMAQVALRFEAQVYSVYNVSSIECVLDRMAQVALRIEIQIYSV